MHEGGFLQGCVALRTASGGWEDGTQDGTQMVPCKAVTRKVGQWQAGHRR